MIHSLLHFIFNVTILIMDLFQLICLISILTYDFSKFEMMEYLYKNWSLNLIKNIKIEYQTSSEYYNTINMDKDLQIIESIINITFPRILQGCDCTIFNSKIYKGKCSKELLNKNCYDIEPKEPIYLYNLYLPEINNLSPNNNGIKISIERFENLSYLDLLNNAEQKEDYFISENKECNCDKYSKVCLDCGVIDSLGNHLCITSYKGIDNNCYKIQLEYDYSLKNTKLIKDLNMIFNHSKINIHQKYISFPVEFMTVFNNSKACILQDETISSPKIKYNLIYYNNIKTVFNPGMKNMGCISELFFRINQDNRWVPIYSLPMEYLLEPNFKKELKQLPLFPYEIMINNLSLAYRTFIGIKNKCNNITIFIRDEIISYDKLLKIRFLLLLFFSLIFFPSLLLFYMMVSQIDILVFSQKMVFAISFSGIIIIFLESLYFELIDMKAKYEKLYIIANNYCGDDLTNNLFFCILNDFENLHNWTVFCCYWTLIMFLANICKICLIITKYCKKRIMFYLNFGNSSLLAEMRLII